MFQNKYWIWNGMFWANLVDLWSRSKDWNDPIKGKPKKQKSKIIYQTNIEEWNWGKKRLIKKTMQNKTNSN
jgi:hypothetical protein